MTVKDYSGMHRATIMSYDSDSRTAKVIIPAFTGDVEVTAKFMYPVSHDDRDTELPILEGAHAYIFFEGGDKYSPVICGYSSHGERNLKEIRRIRQKNIEIIAIANLLLKAENVRVEGDTLFMDNVVVEKNLTVKGTSDLKGQTTIEDTAWDEHEHINGNNGFPTGGVIT